jgi:hypothetical protein
VSAHYHAETGGLRPCDRADCLIDVPLRAEAEPSIDELIVRELRRIAHCMSASDTCPCVHCAHLRASSGTP